MKPLSLVFGAFLGGLLISGLCSPASAQTVPTKTRLIVLPEEYAQSFKAEFARQLQEALAAEEPIAPEKLPDFSALLTDGLVAKGPFEVLERSAIGAVNKELVLGQTEYADLEKAVKMGQMLNAEYAVLPEVRLATVAAQVEQIPHVPVARKGLQATIEIHVRVVDVATSGLVCSFTEASPVAVAIDANTPSTPADGLVFAGAVYRAAAASAVNRIADELRAKNAAGTHASGGE